MRINFLVTSLCLGAALAVLSSGARAQDFRLHGAAALGKSVVLPNLTAIESQSGVRLAVLINGSGNGLLDLAAGKADMAMIAAPLEAEAKIVNARAPGTLDISGLRASQVARAKLNLIVNKANAVKLSAAQARDILGGKIANWKEVGGADGPILLVAEVPGQGARAVVESVFIKGELAAGALTVHTLAEVADVVRQSPNAIGYGNSGSITPAVRRVAGIDIPQPLSLVTQGEPNPTAARVIAAVASHAR